MEVLSISLLIYNIVVGLKLDKKKHWCFIYDSNWLKDIFLTIETEKDFLNYFKF